MSDANSNKCLVMRGAQTTLRGAGTSNIDWWPNQLNIGILHQHHPDSNPVGVDFDYAKAFAQIDLKPRGDGYLYDAYERQTGENKWTATRVDLVQGNEC